MVERLSKYHATLAPCLNIVVPFVDRIAYKHVLKEIPLDDATASVYHQGQYTSYKWTASCIFRLPMPCVLRTVPRTISLQSQLAQTTLRSVIGRMELDKTFEEREHINTTIVNAIDESAANWGVKVLRYEIKDLTPPKEILHAMRAQITAERENVL